MSETAAILYVAAGLLFVLALCACITFVRSRSAGDQPPMVRLAPFESIFDEFYKGRIEMPKKISARKFRPSVRAKIRAKRCGLRLIR